MNAPDAPCPVCWGSHGCDLPAGHDNPGRHICGVGEYEELCTEIRWTGESWIQEFYAEDGELGGDVYPIKPFMVSTGPRADDGPVPTPADPRP